MERSISAYTGAAFRAQYYHPYSHAERLSKEWRKAIIASLQESVLK